MALSYLLIRDAPLDQQLWFVAFGAAFLLYVAATWVKDWWRWRAERKKWTR